MGAALFDRAKLFAKGVCMCCVKKVPFVGEALEVIELVGARREMATLKEQIGQLEAAMTGYERRDRDSVRIEMEAVLAGFRSSGLDSEGRAKHIRNLRQMQANAWSPAMFEDLLQNSPDWRNLCRNPQDYGQLLTDHQPLNPDWIHIFVDADKTRILQMPPQMFGTVLGGQRVGGGAAPTMVCSQDVFAFSPAAQVAGVVAPPTHRIEAPAEVDRPARVISLPSSPPRQPRSLTALLRQARQEHEAKAVRQRKLDAEYAVACDALAKQVAAGEYAEAAKTLLAVEALRPPVAESREVRAFLMQRVPLSFPRRTFTNSAGMKFVEIFPGSFVMGSPAGEAERGDDETQHKVTLTRGFWLGVHQVTQAQWQAVMGANPSHFKGERLPVEQLGWKDCQPFCEQLGKKDGNKYRLPTEAEWEYACRAGTTTPFSFGQTITTDQANYNGTSVYVLGHKGKYRQTTTPAGTFTANPWGLHDMHGNVWEWCRDSFAAYPVGEQIDPLVEHSGSARVLRGGSWKNLPGDCRSARRSCGAAGFQYAYNFRIGLRLVVFPAELE